MVLSIYYWKQTYLQYYLVIQKKVNLIATNFVQEIIPFIFKLFGSKIYYMFKGFQFYLCVFRKLQFLLGKYSYDESSGICCAIKTLIKLNIWE